MTPEEKQAKWWADRQEQKYIEGEKRIEEYYNSLKTALEETKEQIEYAVNEFHIRYMLENNVNSYAEAQKLLSKTELKSLESFIAKSKENIGKYNQSLNNISIKARMTRYEALLTRVDVLLQQVYSIEYETKGIDELKRLYEESYCNTLYNMDVYQGFHSGFSMVDVDSLNEIVAYPFNGANYSTRLWKQKDHLLQQLRESITTMLVTGTSPNKLLSEFTEKFKVKEHEAYRLLHTESSYIMEHASQAAYAEDGVEEYQWLATLDLKTCKVCAPKDGKVFKVGQGIVGKTIPPAHCFCRCTTVPYFDDEEYDRNARGEDGATYKVPDSMTYQEWKDKYIENSVEENSKGDIIKAIKDIGIKGGVKIPPRAIDITKLIYDESHINAERSHNVTKEQAISYIINAELSLSKWDGKFENYYSKEGATFVDVDNNKIRTAFTKEQYDDNSKKIVEVIEKYGK